MEVYSWGPREEVSEAVVERRVRRAEVLAGVGRKRVEGPRRVVQSFQPVFVLFGLLGLSLRLRMGRLRMLFRHAGTLLAGGTGIVSRDRGTKKSSSTCQRGVSYSDVGVVARRVSQ